MPYTKGMIGELAAKGSGTWKELGVHYATLGALAKKGLLEKDESGRYTVTSKGLMFDRIEALAADYEYVTLRKEGDRLAMMCSVKGTDILDAWDNVWGWGETDLWFNDYRHSRTEIRVSKN